jgi:hypothetical protein
MVYKMISGNKFPQRIIHEKPEKSYDTILFTVSTLQLRAPRYSGRDAGMTGSDVGGNKTIQARSARWRFTSRQAILPDALLINANLFQTDLSGEFWEYLPETLVLAYRSNQLIPAYFWCVATVHI